MSRAERLSRPVLKSILLVAQPSPLVGAVEAENLVMFTVVDDIEHLASCLRDDLKLSRRFLIFRVIFQPLYFFNYFLAGADPVL